MKTPKVKKREVSKNSRAARRGEDAAPNNRTSTAVEETDYKPWLHRAQDAGVSKKKKGKQLSRQQKLRHQKGLENADRNANKLEKKMADSKERGQKIKARAIDWDNLNGDELLAGVSQRKTTAATTATSSATDEVKLDEDMTLAEDVVEPSTTEKEVPQASAQPVSVELVDEVT